MARAPRRREGLGEAGGTQPAAPDGEPNAESARVEPEATAGAPAVPPPVEARTDDAPDEEPAARTSADELLALSTSAAAEPAPTGAAASPTPAPAAPPAAVTPPNVYASLLVRPRTPVPGAQAGDPEPFKRPEGGYYSAWGPPPASPPAASPPPLAAPPPGRLQPPADSPPTPEGGPYTPPARAETEGWFWCPTDLIASEKPGTCANCGKPYQPAPPWGIPAGPYRPKVSSYQRTRKESVAYVAAALVLVALVAGAALGLTTLYRHGTPLDSAGQPVASDAGSAPTDASTPLVLRSLEGKSLVLSGHWQQTRQIYTAMINLAKTLTNNNSQPPLDVAVTKGSATVAVFNAASSNPQQAMSALIQPGATTNSDSGGVLTIGASQMLTIDGKASNYTDISRSDSTGQLLSLRIFLIPTADHVVMVAVGTTGSRDDIDTVTQALKAI